MQAHHLSYPSKLKIAKWFFALAVLFFVGKPFIGFEINGATPVSQFTILVKSFTKRKHDYVDNSSYDIKTVQKQLANPINTLMLLFSALLAFILPRIADELSAARNSIPHQRKLSLVYSPSPWLSNHQFLI